MGPGQPLLGSKWKEKNVARAVGLQAVFALGLSPGRGVSLLQSPSHQLPGASEPVWGVSRQSFRLDFQISGSKVWGNSAALVSQESPGLSLLRFINLTKSCKRNSFWGKGLIGASGSVGQGHWVKRACLPHVRPNSISKQGVEYAPSTDPLRLCV